MKKIGKVIQPIIVKRYNIFEPELFSIKIIGVIKTKEEIRKKNFIYHTPNQLINLLQIY